jgi:hypothetical protein
MAALKGPASLRPRCTRSGSSVAAIPVYAQWHNINMRYKGKCFYPRFKRIISLKLCLNTLGILEERERERKRERESLVRGVTAGCECVVNTCALCHIVHPTVSCSKEPTLFTPLYWYLYAYWYRNLLIKVLRSSVTGHTMSQTQE